MNDKPIKPEDIEASLRNVDNKVKTQATDAKSKLIPIAIGGGIVLALLLFILGRRVGAKKTTLVEIRRI